MMSQDTIFAPQPDGSLIWTAPEHLPKQMPVSVRLDAFVDENRLSKMRRNFDAGIRLNDHRSFSSSIVSSDDLGDAVMYTVCLGGPGIGTPVIIPPQLASKTEAIAGVIETHRKLGFGSAYECWWINIAQGDVPAGKSQITGLIHQDMPLDSLLAGNRNAPYYMISDVEELATAHYLHPVEGIDMGVLKEELLRLEDQDDRVWHLHQVFERSTNPGRWMQAEPFRVTPYDAASLHQGKVAMKACPRTFMLMVARLPRHSDLRLANNHSLFDWMRQNGQEPPVAWSARRILTHRQMVDFY